MRIGVCFFGRIKHYDKKYLIESFGSNHSYDFFYSSDDEPADLINQFIELYHPISIDNNKISYDVDFSIYSPPHPQQMHNMTCHFINKKRVFGLLETHCNLTNTHYDLIISVRLDLYIDKFEPELPIENTIYIPTNEDHNGINDRFAMGDFKTMKQYMNIFDNCLYLLDNKITVAHPERLTLSNIQHCNINVNRLNLYHNINRE
jgi:hypothetical protein